MSLLIISVLFHRNKGLRWLADFLPWLKSFFLELRLSTPKGLLAHPWAQGWLVPWWQVRTNWFLGAFTRNPLNSVPGLLQTLETFQTPRLVFSTPCFTRRAPGPQVSPPKFSHNCITFARMVLDHRKQTDGRTHSPQNSFAVKSTRSAKAYIKRKDNEGFECTCSHMYIYICYLHICWLMQACMCWFMVSLNSGTQVLIYHLFLPKLYNMEQVMLTNNEGLCQIAGNCSRMACITIALPNWGFAFAPCPLLWPQPWIVDTLLIDSLVWLPRINVITKVTMISLFIGIKDISTTAPPN